MAPLGQLAACSHDAKRGNPLDPELTPPVEMVSAAVDSVAGAATLNWTRYVGDQPFGSYEINRRKPDGIAGRVQPEASLLLPHATAACSGV